VSPVDTLGRAGWPALQLISFSIERDEDQRFSKWITYSVKKGDTVQRICARRGHPEDAQAVAKKNGVRSTTWVLIRPPLPKRKKGQPKPKRKGPKSRYKILVPGEMAEHLQFNVLAGDTPPKIVGGYAKYSTTDRPERMGLTVFNGYDPVTMEVPVRFEAQQYETLDAPAEQIEKDIGLLERMAGRGNFEGSNIGPSAVIRISTTSSTGTVVPLVPRNYQWGQQNKTGPLWRITGIDWDQDAWRNRWGNRLRQLATITVQQYTSVRVVQRSVAVRAKSKPKKKKGKGKGKGKSTRGKD